MEKQDKLYMSIYNDFYGGLLTDYQSRLISMYYDEDMSLAEIGKEYGISPQGVRDALMRAEKTLTTMESKLGLVKKTLEMKRLLLEFEKVATDEQKKEIKQALAILEE
ncbi:MAG: sigma factor-like helix-turn-helix DNA-binding protein [Christensenellales bacterium]